MKLEVPVSIYDKTTGHILHQFTSTDLVAVASVLEANEGLYIPLRLDGSLQPVTPVTQIDPELFYLPNGVLTPRQNFAIKFHLAAELTDFGIEYPEVDLNWLAVFTQPDAANPGSWNQTGRVYVSNVPAGTLVKVPGQPLFVSSGGDFSFEGTGGQDKLLFQHPAYKPWQIQFNS